MLKSLQYLKNSCGHMIIVGWNMIFSSYGLIPVAPALNLCMASQVKLIEVKNKPVYNVHSRILKKISISLDDDNIFMAK